MDGDGARGRERVRALERYTEDGGSDGEGFYLIARLYALLSDRAAALRMFQRAVDHGFFAYPYIAADPFMASVHDHSAFQSTLARARVRHEAFRALVSAQGMPLVR
jgi:hypothetical protein